MGILAPTKKKAMEQEVLPWLMGQIIDYLKEDQTTTNGSVSVVQDGILDA